MNADENELGLIPEMDESAYKGRVGGSSERPKKLVRFDEQLEVNRINSENIFEEEEISCSSDGEQDQLEGIGKGNKKLNQQICSKTQMQRLSKRLANQFLGSKKKTREIGANS